MTVQNSKATAVIAKKARGVKVPTFKRLGRKRCARISFWKPLTLEELARLQGVKPVRKLEDVLGGWPEGEEDDGFEKALAAWRKADVERKR